MGFEEVNKDFASYLTIDQTINPMSGMALCVLNAFNKSSNVISLSDQDKLKSILSNIELVISKTEIICVFTVHKDITSFLFEDVK